MSIPIRSAVDIDFFRALAEPTRVGILGVLVAAGGEANVGTIAGGVDIDTSVVSRHLKELARAGVVTVERRGRERWYALDVDACQAVIDRFSSFLDNVRHGRPCC